MAVSTSRMAVSPRGPADLGEETDLEREGGVAQLVGVVGESTLGPPRILPGPKKYVP